MYSPGYNNLGQVAKPIGIFKQFISKEPQTIVLREKVLSLSGDSFNIKSVNGKPLLKVQGAWVSISGRKRVEDVNGNHLFDIVKELLHLHATYAIESPRGEKMCEVRNNIRATASFTGLNGKTVTLEMKGSWLDYTADIVDNKTGLAVARIDRKLLSGRNLLFGQQTYAVVVAPGVDAALVAALCICFDEKNNERRRR